jgi:hypothetical protein
MAVGLADRYNSVDPLLGSLVDRYNDETGYLLRPWDWVHDKADEYAWGTQREVMESVRDNRYTAVPSCHDSGKSWVASRIIGWWMDTHPPGSAFVVSTAPTAAQVHAILWRELNRLHEYASLKGKINRAGYPQWYMGNELVGYGRKPSDYDESAFQGIHSEYPLIVVDEAGGIKKSLFDAVDALATNENARVLAIGNPDDPGSYFATVAKADSDWHVIQIDGLRTPNFCYPIIVGDDPDHPRYPLVAALMAAEGISFNTEDVPPSIRPNLLSPLWVEERIIRWGGVAKDAHRQMTPAELAQHVQQRCATSSLFMAKVRGIFPDTRSQGVLPLGWVQLAINRWKDWVDAGKPPQVGRRVVGVDPAYLGTEGDETAIALRQGECVERVVRYRDADTIETADNAARYLHESGSIAVVDVIGIGAGVVDSLRKYKREGKIKAEIIQFVAGASSTRYDRIGALRFRNDRAAAWWNFRERLDPSRGSRVMLPDDERLIEELVSVKVVNQEGGILKIESKEEIRKRLGRSSDSADSVVQSFWMTGDTLSGSEVAWRPAAKQFEQMQHDVIRYDGYNPFTDEHFDLHGIGDGMDFDTELQEY